MIRNLEACRARCQGVKAREEPCPPSGNPNPLATDDRATRFPWVATIESARITYMKTETIEVSTSQKIDALNITGLVNEALRRLKVREGICLVSIPHTTCGLVINEDEEGLVEDVKRMARTLLTPLARQSPFLHDRIDDNAQAHLTSSLLGRSLIVPVTSGSLRLGTWQSLLLVECDGPRRRRVEVTVIDQ